MEIINSNNIDKDTSLFIAKTMLEMLDGTPMENSLDALNGIVVAMDMFLRTIKENSELSEENGLEKLVLSWLSSSDVIMGTKFSLFISPDVIHIDKNEL